MTAERTREMIDWKAEKRSSRIELSAVMTGRLLGYGTIVALVWMTLA